MSAARPRSPPSGITLLLLVSALAVGAASAILFSATGASANGGSPTTEVYFGNDIVVAAIVGIFVAIAGAIVYRRLQGGAALPSQFVVGILVTVLVMIGFVVLLQHFWNAGVTTTPEQQSNGTGHAPPPPPSGHLGGPGGSLNVLHFPPWSIFLAVAVIAVVVAAVVLPRIRTYLAERGEGGSTNPAADEAREALGVAARRLAEGHDPRSVVRELYGRLLARIQPLAGNIDPSTPDEIRSGPLRSLGIRAEAAEALTRLFEEARYSSHPMGPDAVDRARRAVADAESDLARLSAAGP